MGVAENTGLEAAVFPKAQSSKPEKKIPCPKGQGRTKVSWLMGPAAQTADCHAGLPGFHQWL
jgi:hypothetical protein